MALRIVRRPAEHEPVRVEADICVVGSGMAGVSAALEAAWLGRRVVIVDAAPALGGQAVGSIVGTIIGLYTHGPSPYQITHLVADELLADLGREGSLHRRRSATGTITFQYDEVRLGRWIESKVHATGIQALVGTVLTGVARALGEVRARACLLHPARLHGGARRRQRRRRWPQCGTPTCARSPRSG